MKISWLNKISSLLYIFLLPGLQAFSQVSPTGTTSPAGQDRKKAPGMINTDQFTEFAPSISADGKTMIMESNRLGGWKLFQSKLNADGTWSAPVSLDKVNSFGDSADLIGGPSISYDGNILYFFASFKNGFGSEDIYYSLREGDGWGSPVNIGPQINTNDYEGFPSVSSDGKSLYFTRIRKDFQDKNFSETCFTIYQSKKDAKGNWVSPEPLPYPVNYLCDKAPRIMADNRTLIFSSYRPGTQGSFDLYQTQVDDDGEWSDPVPLTFVNSPQSDMFACISAAGDLMYFNTSNDIWSVVIPQNLRQFKNVVMQGFVSDADTHDGLGIKIRVSDATTSERIFEIENNATDGRYSVVMASGKTYNVEFFKDGYSSAVYSYDLRNKEAYNMINQDVQMFKTVRLRLNVYDKELFEPLPGEIRVVSEATGTQVADVNNDPAKGFVELNLPIGADYKISVDLKNFAAESFSFDINRQVLYRDFERDVELVPDKVNVPINVSDISNSSKVKGKVIIRNKSRDEVIEVNSNEMISLRVGDRYEIEATSDKGYFFASATVNVTSAGIQPVGSANTAADVIDGAVEMKLTPITQNTSLNLNDILFESGSAQLSDVSYKELDRVVTVMKDNPTMRVEVSAHTDDIGSDSYNLALSEKRAQSVVDYLESNDISRDRLNPKGYGETHPLVTNDSDANRSKNRRVELKVLEVLR